MSRKIEPFRTYTVSAFAKLFVDATGKDMIGFVLILRQLGFGYLLNIPYREQTAGAQGWPIIFHVHLPTAKIREN